MIRAAILKERMCEGLKALGLCRLSHKSPFLGGASLNPKPHASRNVCVLKMNLLR